MKRLASIALVLAGVPFAAQAKKEAFPISGQLQLSYRTSHSAFVPAEGEDVNFGAGVMRLATSFFWSPESAPSLTLFAGFNFSRAVYETFNRAPFNPQVKPGVTLLSDINTGLNWNFAKAGPFIFTGGLSGSVGMSNIARATGRVFSMSPSLSVTAVTPIGLIANVSGSAGMNFNTDPTVQVNDQATQNRLVSGSDTGISNQAGTTSWSAALSYQALPGLFLSTSYFQDMLFSAVIGEDDEFTSEHAQTGIQSSDPFHGMAFVVRYQMKQLGGGAADAFNAAAEGARKNEDPWTNHVAISAAMFTYNRLYDPDNKSLSNPFFDSSSDLHGRTIYIVTLTGIM